MVVIPSTLYSTIKEKFPYIFYHSTSLLNTGLGVDGLPRPSVKPLVPSGILGLFKVSFEDASHTTWPLECTDDVTGKL